MTKMEIWPRNWGGRKLAVALAVLALSSVLSATEYFVATNGVDNTSDNTWGRTEATAFRTIQAAVNKASANDTITLLPGDHVEGSANNSRVNVTKVLVIRSKNGRATRDVTRIVGAYDDNAASTGGMGSNSVRCLRIAQAGSGSRIEGVTFYRGSTDYNGNAAAEVSEGGGVYVASSGNATIVDCAFVECAATRGGGAYSDSTGSALKVVRCLFLRCRDTKFGAAMRGGAAYFCVFDDCGKVTLPDGSSFGESHSKNAFAYGWTAVNCTFVNNEGAGLQAIEDCFKGGIYNCLFQNNVSRIENPPTTGEMDHNTDNTAYTTRMDVFSPYDGDYRLTVDSAGVNAGSGTHLSSIPEEFRGTDYCGNTFTAGDEIHAGAVQDALAAAASGVGLRSHPTEGSWTLGGEPVAMAFRTWRGTVGWPVPQKVGFVPSAGRALVRFSIGDAPLWPLMDDTVWVHNSRIGQCQTVGLVSTSSIFYADPENGDDETGDGSEEHPFETITKAIQFSTSTHVVRAKAGDYTNGTQQVCGFAARVAVQDGLQGELRVIAVDGPDATFITGVPGTANDYSLGTDAVRCIGVASTNAFRAAFQGFTLRNGHTISGSDGGPATFGGGFANVSANGTSSLGTGWLLDCRVEDCSGQRGGAMAGGTALRCTFARCRSANSYGCVFRYCSVVSSFVTECGGKSELFGAGSTARNVTMWSNTASSIYHGTYGDGALYNSVSDRNGGGNDLSGSNITDSGVRYCLYAKAANVPDGVTLSTSANEDPVRFLDPATGNFRLREDSAGFLLASTSLLGSCMDINGDPFVFDLGTGTYQAGCFAPRPAATIHVDAANGSDATGDGSEAAPYATLAAAMSAAEHGDTVVALPGTYEAGTMVPNKSQVGGMGDNVVPTVAARVVVKTGVTLKSRDGAAATTIRGAAATGGGCGPDAVRCVFLCRDATLRGFTLTGGYTAATCLSDGSESPTVDNYGGGVAGYAGSEATDNEFLGLVENCVISNNMALRGGGARYGTYRNCVFSGNTLCAGKPGLAVYAARLEGCLFYGNGDTGWHSVIYDSQVVNCTILGGQAEHSGAIINESAYVDKRATVNSIVMAGKVNVKAMTNCVLAASTVNLYAGEPATNNVIVGGTTLDADGVPLAGSSAIDAGDASFCPAEFLAGRDPAGVRRVLNSTVDIGAFEFDWGVPWGAAVCGRRLRFVDMPSDASLEGGGTLVFTGSDVPVEAEWARGNGNAPFKFTAQVHGAGTLTVSTNGSTMATLAAADGAVQLKFASALAANSLVFSYDGDDPSGVALYGFSQNTPLVIIIR